MQRTDYQRKKEAQMLIEEKRFQKIADLYWSISPDMKLTKGFFMKLHDYAKDRPDIVEVFMQCLEFYGCSRARQYYQSITGEKAGEMNGR